MPPESLGAASVTRCLDVDAIRTTDDRHVIPYLPQCGAGALAVFFGDNGVDTCAGGCWHHTEQ